MNIKLVIIIIIVLATVTLLGWYVYTAMNGAPVQQENTAEESQNNAPDATATIETELNANQSDAEAEAEMNSLDQSVKSF